jgi:glycosyltransferase involved in cell wall biosynthesis
MESTPALTVGVPVYNMGTYLEAAVESILSQSFWDLEVIISDNASTDDTETIGRALASRDSRVIYRRNPRNIGLAGNFNLLVPLARGRLFKWAAADDELRPGYLERCVAAFAEAPDIALAYSRSEFVDGDGNPLDIDDPGWQLTSDDPAERLRSAVLAGGFVNAVLGVIRTDALRRTRLLPRYAGGDFRLMAELSVLGRFVEIPDVLYVRRIHGASSKGNAGDPRWLRRYMSGARSGVRAAYWRLSLDRAGIVVRAPIPLTRKAAILARLARLMRYHWRRLADELVDLARR